MSANSKTVQAKWDDTTNETETIFTDKESTGGFCDTLNVVYNRNFQK